MNDDEISPKKAKGNDGNSKEAYGSSSYRGDEKFFKMMEKMGHKEGEGLGARKQGIIEPIAPDGASTRHGLGHEARKFAINDSSVKWDASVENKTVEEYPIFIESSDELRDKFTREFHNKWIVEGEPIVTLMNSTDFCDPDLVREVIEAKGVFDHLDRWVINEARKRANPYETVMGGIFQNRAAMKTANLDRVLDWRLSREFDEQKRLAKNPIEADSQASNSTRDEEIFYFADVCAGPGGFSEYMIWRKAFYNVKGFGFTLRGNDDFKLNNFKAGSAAFFETFYGKHKDGDVTKPENLSTLENYVKVRTNGKKCHLVMCDGGFSVEGKEEIQEVMSKRLYLCQFIVGLSLARVEDGDSEPGGNYLCKLFDVFTPFSAGLIYLMYIAFRKITLHKPNTSRPANSERYIFCEGLTEFGSTVIKNYLVHINDELEKMGKETTILEVVPFEFMEQDSVFFDYFVKNNEDFARRQIIYLNKYKEFARNKGVFDQDQADLREKCLKYWEVPNKPRTMDFNEQPAQLALKSLMKKHDFMYGHVMPFTSKFWNPSPKQIVLREICAVLMPEHTDPMLLVSNEKGDAFIFRSEHHSEKLVDLRLPPKSLLLVQEMTLYTTSSGNIEPYAGRSKIIFVVDACRLNNDDISELNYKQRLTTISKFCQTINRGLESINTDLSNQKRTHGGQPTRKIFSYYFHTAEALELIDLEEQFKKLRCATCKSKCLPIALQDFKFPTEFDVDFPNDSPRPRIYFPCQGVRFVKLFKDWKLCWSNSQATFFYFGTEKGENLEKLNPKMFASAFDHFPSSKRESLVSMWRWKIDPQKGYEPRVILQEEEYNGFLTVKYLCNEIRNIRKEYNQQAMTEPFM